MSSLTPSVRSSLFLMMGWASLLTEGCNQPGKSLASVAPATKSEEVGIEPGHDPSRPADAMASLTMRQGDTEAEVLLAVGHIPRRVDACAPFIVEVTADARTFLQGRLEVSAFHDSQAPGTNDEVPILTTLHIIDGQGDTSNDKFPFVFRIPASGVFRVSASLDGLRVVEKDGGAVVKAFSGSRVVSAAVVVEGTTALLPPTPILGGRWITGFKETKAEILDEHESTLQKIASVLKEGKSTVWVYGYSDKRKPKEEGLTNCLISEARAFAVREWLIRSGVEQERISAEGKCETGGVSKNEWTKARRVEVWVADYPSCGGK
jgi:OmpA family